MTEAEEIIRAFIAAYADGKLDEVRRLVADDMVAYVTNAEGGVDEVRGREGFLARLPDTSDAELTIDVTQSVTVEPGRAMTMVEIHAGRDEARLHNFSAFLTRVRGGQLSELWMVEALPAYSDEFWS